MTAGTAWLQAFPLTEADRAVQALMTSWRAMASIERLNFNPRIDEPKLTRVVRAHVRKIAAPEMNLLGHWGAEGVENDIDFETGHIRQEARTDVIYAWNNEVMNMTLVFEFKKLNDQNQSRTRYLNDGVMRFVTGLYSEREPIATMVGILMAPRPEAVDGLRRAIAKPAVAASVSARANPSGHFVSAPSLLFPRHADFDTEHVRAPEKAPPHGTIRIAHLFVEFPYITYAEKRRRRAKVARELEDAERDMP